MSMDGENFENYVELREVQAEKLLQSPDMSNPMGYFEIVAYLDGFPPDYTDIVTPESFRQDVENGKISPEDTPLAVASNILEDLCGPQEKLALTSTFGNEANNTFDDMLDGPEHNLNLDGTKIG